MGASGSCAPAPSLTVPRCTPGQAGACACANGGSGAKICQGDGTFGRCDCQSNAGLSEDATGGTGPEPAADAGRGDESGPPNDARDGMPGDFDVVSIDAAVASLDAGSIGCTYSYSCPPDSGPASTSETAGIDVYFSKLCAWGCNTQPAGHPPSTPSYGVNLVGNIFNDWIGSESLATSFCLCTELGNSNVSLSGPPFPYGNGSGFTPNQGRISVVRNEVQVGLTYSGGIGGPPGCLQSLICTGSAAATFTSCDANHGGCDSHAGCTWTGPGTNSCTCNGGYSGNGYTCTLGVDAGPSD